ncbi:ISL3 family transposase [Butyrivibrio sp. FC2001]|jgi:transposase|uniref:ISL3 family transposase n=2 Tax=unclassified Butyrivibrio TaxID=2639466 RepID=UPI000420490D|nr:ISL3 family transposase [Butyrivibrio sp. FC2001]
MNSITDLLDLEDGDLCITGTQIQGHTKTLTIETKPVAHYCPNCGYRMYSRGVKKRKVNHPILQDSYSLVIILKQRRWRCTNPECLYDISENFKFVNKRRRTSNATDMLIVSAYRDLMETSVSIARKFHVSDSHAHEVFDRYVKLDRLPLTDAVSIDEVCIDMDEHCKYALVIQDFHTGDPIDLLRSRRNDVTEPYFSAIPIEERLAVKYLISDMYKPYIAYVEKYFPNAIPVVDSFHVIQWITRLIDNYIRQLIKKYRQRDRELQDKLSIERHEPVSLPVSDEVYILQKYRWLILSNLSNIRYHQDLRMDPHFHRLMNTFDYEDALFRIDPNLQEFRDLKEKYVQFNSRNSGNPHSARLEIAVLIKEYRSSRHDIFRDFASLLEKFEDPIINSFIMVEKMGNGKIYDSRLSNGPIESINRKIKDLKRMGRGFRNFEHFRNRFLYSTRSAPILNGVSDYNPVVYFEEDEF